MIRIKLLVLASVILARAAAGDLSLGSAQTITGGTAILSVILDTQGAQLSGLQFDLSYDLSWLTIVMGPGSAATAAGKTVNVGGLSTGQRVVVVGLNQTLIGSGEVVDLGIRVGAGTPAGVYPMALINVSATDPSGQPLQLGAFSGSMVVANPPPQLTISKSHAGNFTQGQQGAAYTVVVANQAATGPTSGTVTVTEAVPPGLSLVSMAGAGWACSASTCTRSDTLNSAASYPPIAVIVNVASNAPSPQVNAVSVTGGGAAMATASDSTVIAPQPAAITMQTVPAGLQFSVDGGTPQTAPQTLSLSQGVHTITVAAAQAGVAGTQYVFTAWSDSGVASHSIIVGTAAATYTATFKTQYQLTIAASPAAGGVVTPLNGAFYDAGTVVPVTATVNAGYTFSGWSGAVANAAISPTTVTMSAAQSITANFSSLTGITIQTSPPGLQFSVDGGAAQTAPQSLNLSQGTHTVAVVTTQSGPPGTQYAFTAWTDNGAASHNITVSSSAATYIASFQTQYQLTVAASPAAGGTVTPASGTFYNAGTVVPVNAAANAGYAFSGWSGGVATPGSVSTTATISSVLSLTANFAGQPPAAITVFSPAQAAAGISLATSLAWSAATGATSYDIYFGASTTPPFVTNTTATSYLPAMLPGTTYYWSVSARNAFGSAPSAVWSFTTAYQTTAGSQFIPVAPCRVMDTRSAAGTFGGPSIPGGSARIVPIPQSACGIPATAQAYSLNITVVPPGPLTYLSVWPAGQSQPVVSTLDSLDGRVVANAAIVPAGANGAISVYVTDTTDAIIDINGYFAPASGVSSAPASLSFYTATPCRVVDTRNANGPFGGPFLSGGATRSFAIPASSCGIPAAAQAYSLNVTVVPHQPLAYLTVWPAGQSQPLVSTLNSLDGSVVANTAIVPAGGASFGPGAVSVYATDDTDVILDINGYFAPPGSPGALSLYTLAPCRVADTRGASGPFGGPALAADGTRTFAIPSSACSVPPTAQAYSLNVTVVPPGPLTYLTAWPAGLAQPVVSTLNSPAGKVVANAAIVPAGTSPSGAVSLFVSNTTNVILDINAYFAQ